MLELLGVAHIIIGFKSEKLVLKTYPICYLTLTYDGAFNKDDFNWCANYWSFLPLSSPGTICKIFMSSSSVVNSLQPYSLKWYRPKHASLQRWQKGKRHLPHLIQLRLSTLCSGWGNKTTVTDPHSSKCKCNIQQCKALQYRWFSLPGESNSIFCVLYFLK